MNPTRLSALVAHACLLPGLALGQSPTAFSYQGRLDNGGQPASGSHDIQFRLYDAETGGTQVGTIQCADNVAVAGGLFTALVDFGVLGAAPRWLEIGVRADSAAGNCAGGSYTSVSPRQRVTAAPVAAYALNYRTPHSLDAADGSPANAVYVGNQGYVGIGTTSPVAPLDVRSGNGSFVRVDPVNGDLHGNGGVDGFFGIYNDGPAAGSTEIIYNNTVLFRVMNAGWAAVGAPPIAGTRLNVGGNLNVTGAITFPARTRTLTLHAASFAPNVTGHHARYYTNGVALYELPPEDFLIAAVNLPDGAVITGITLSAIDNAGGRDISAQIGRSPFSWDGGDIMGGVGMSGASPLVRLASTSTLVYNTVDNDSYSYWVRVYMQAFGAAPDQRVQGVKIHYTVTTPLP